MQDTAAATTENPLRQRTAALVPGSGEKEPETNPLARRINPLLRSKLKAMEQKPEEKAEGTVPAHVDEIAAKADDKKEEAAKPEQADEKNEAAAPLAKTEEKRKALLANPDEAVEIKREEKPKEEAAPQEEAKPQEEQQEKAPETEGKKPEEASPQEEAKPREEEKKTEAASPAPEQEEEKPKRRTRRKKASEEAAAPSTMSKPDDIKSFEFDTVDLFGTKHTFEEACAIATSQFVDEEWLKFRDDINAKVKQISLKDVKPGAVSYIIEEIDCILSEIADPLEKVTTLMKIIMDPNCGIGTAIRKQAALSGNNAHERDAAGLNALMKAKVNGEDINLMQLLAAATVRKSFLDSIKERLERKQAMLITIAADNKVQAEMAR